MWHDTYQCDAATRGLFEDDIQPYHIGKNKFSVRDLVSINNDEIKKKYNEFATILRQHNVGAKENAFDKLVNLFLAKVVDETNNPDDLHFYWKGAAYDDDFSLQDRLQRLYRDGMEKFLNETVTIIRYAIPVPHPSIQQQIVEEISVHEAKIAEAKAVINSSAERKQAILDKYLKDNK